MAKELEIFKEKDAKYNQTRVSLDEEIQRRISTENELDRVRTALADLQSKSSIDIENLKRNLEELKLNN